MAHTNHDGDDGLPFGKARGRDGPCGGHGWRTSPSSPPPIGTYEVSNATVVREACMPMEPVWLQCICARDWRRCGRCGSENVRDLGTAGSHLDWLTCDDCSQLSDATDTATVGSGVTVECTPWEKVGPVTRSQQAQRLRVSMLFAKVAVTLSVATRRVGYRLWRLAASR
jgi:hypothetical protein